MSSKFKKKFYRPQVDSSDCGVAALGMVLEYYGSHYSIATLRELSGTTREGTSVWGIAKAAEQLNLEVDILRADMSLFDNPQDYLPFIVHAIKNDEFPHYYLVTGCNNRFIYIADPDDSIKFTKMSREKFACEWTGVVIFFTPNRNYQKFSEKKVGLFDQFIKFALDGRNLVYLFVVTFLYLLFNLSGVYYINFVLDNYLSSPNKYNLLQLSVLVLLSHALSKYMMKSGELYLANSRKNLEQKLMLQYFSHIINLPLKFFETRIAGDIVSRFNEISNVVEVVSNILSALILNFITILAVSIIIVTKEPILLLVSIVPVPLYMLLSFVFYKKFRTLNGKISYYSSRLSSSLIEDINGIQTIKSTQSEQVMVRKFKEELYQYLNSCFYYDSLKINQRAVRECMKLCLSTVTIWCGINLVLIDSVTLGELMTYNLLIVYIFDSIDSLISLQPEIQKAQISNIRLEEVMRLDTENKISGLEEKDMSLRGNICLQNVSYYNQNEQILKNISLTFFLGEKTIIAGPSGSGKTTLAKILVNFYKPSEGKILVNEVDISIIGDKVLRKNICYVPQQPYIFSGTILENLLLGRTEGATLEQVEKAVEIAGIKDEIMEKELQYQTQLGSNGSELSGGQKQRIAIARALLTDAPIIIFDEATSALDAISERGILERLMELEKTIIFVTHKLNLASRADFIVIMDKGRVVESGTHIELVKNKKLYYELVHSY